MVADKSDIVLSAFYNAIHSTLVPFRAHMLGICKAGNSETWPDKGPRPRRVAHS